MLWLLLLLLVVMIILLMMLAAFAFVFMTSSPGVSTTWLSNTPVIISLYYFFCGLRSDVDPKLRTYHLV